jgi:hypothetical protein
MDYLVRALEMGGSEELGVEQVTTAFIVMMRDCGSVTALALIAFLVAPRQDDESGEPFSPGI